MSIAFFLFVFVPITKPAFGCVVYAKILSHTNSKILGTIMLRQENVLQSLLI